MNKKLLLAVCSITAATAMAVGFTACGGNKENNNNGGTQDGGLTADQAATKIAGFTTSPTTIDATFNQTYKLVVNSDNASMKAFEKDIADTVTIQADYTAGNLYYYGKKVAKDNSVTEQLVVKEDSTYYWLTTTTVKTALEDEAAAKAKIDELMTSLTKQTSGYVDSAAFVYNADWVHNYLLLESGTVNGTEKSYFTYTYDNAANDGLKISIDMKYVGYYGDAGTFEFGTDDTHTGATAEITTDSNGYITSFSQTLNNHLDMNITNPAVPLDLTGTRSITASYNGNLTKKTTIDQDLTPGTITVNAVENATVATYDFEQGNYASLATPSDTVSAGNYVAVKVTCEEGYEVGSVTVNGAATQNINGYYCYMIAAEAGGTYAVNVVVIKSGEEVPTVGTIVVNSVENATVETYDFEQGNFASLATPSDTVSEGNFVAIKVTPEEGYVVTSVTVNGTDTTYINGYYCLMQKAVAGATYTVDVTLGQPAIINVNTVEGATINVKGLTFSSMTYTDDVVMGGQFICLNVILDEAHAGYTVSVTVNGAPASDFSSKWEGEGTLFCFMDMSSGAPKGAVGGETYEVVVTLTAAE